MKAGWDVLYRSANEITIKRKELYHVPPEFISKSRSLPLGRAFVISVFLALCQYIHYADSFFIHLFIHFTFIHSTMVPINYPVGINRYPLGIYNLF